MNNFEIVKQAVGERARDIIAGDLGKRVNNEMMCCPYPEHEDKNPSSQWKGDAFHCYSCPTQYDIFTHYEVHHGHSPSEAIKSLAEEFNIKLDDYAAPKLTKRRKVAPKEEYIERVKDFSPSKIDSSDFLTSKFIEPDIAAYMNTTCDSENIYFNHVEKVNDEWAFVNTKQRRLDGAHYKWEKDGVKFDNKEISIAGGTGSFFGLNTLFDGDGKEKAHCILVEGHTDALRVASALYTERLLDFYGVISLPNGAGSMKMGIENSPTFNKWLNKKASTLIMIPDADDAGQMMVKHAREYLKIDKLRKVNICDFGITYQAKRGEDISDLLLMDSALTIESLLEDQQFLSIDECITIEEMPEFDLSIGLNPSFGTHYYNDRGFKGGCVTLVTGVRGEGKTSIARQFLYSMFRNKVKSFAWFAESKGEEPLEMTKIHEYAMGRECNMDVKYLANGQSYHVPTPAAVKDATREMNKYIDYWDKTDQEENAFEKIMAIMKTAIKQGTKFFLIDNLMCLCASTSARNVFDLQKKVMMKFKELAKNNNIHILMLAHPNAKNEKVSGAMEVENLADTIISYARCDYNAVSSYIAATNTQIAAEDIQKISAMLTYSKVRDGGSKSPLFIEWVPEYGVLREIAYLDKVIAALAGSDSIFTRPTVEMC
jgi:archaellum biogenesis ATPase FlaH